MRQKRKWQDKNFGKIVDLIKSECKHLSDNFRFWLLYNITYRFLRKSRKQEILNNLEEIHKMLD